MDRNFDLATVKKALAKWEAKTKEAEILGRQFGNKVKAFPDTIDKATICGVFLDTVAQQEPDHECIELLLDWTFSTFWSIEVERHLPLFDEYWEWLNKHNACQKNPLVWGDIDCSAWIEFPKNTNRKVIIIETHCAARDDNIHLFIRENNTFSDSLDVRTCWPRTQRFKPFAQRSKGWDYVEKASLVLYRKKDFEVRYHDFRDVDYCLSYERILGQRGKVEHGHAHMLDIYWSLWALRGLGTGIEYPLTIPHSAEEGK